MCKEGTYSSEVGDKVVPYLLAETPLNRNVIHEPGRKASIMSHTPMKRYGDLEEIKGVAIFLASDSASFVTAEIICVDGGFMAVGIGP